MGKNDIILCFNQSECTYTKCMVYNDTLSVCELEWLKRIPVQVTAKPSQSQETAQQVPPFKNPPAPPQELTPQQKIAKANEKSFTRCEDIVNGLKGIKVHGRVMDDPVTQHLDKTKKGPMDIIKFRFDDGTAVIRLTFWNPSKVPVLKVGDEITVEGLLGSAPYDGLPQASGGDYVKIIFEKV